MYTTLEFDVDIDTFEKLHTISSINNITVSELVEELLWDAIGCPSFIERIMFN